MLSRVAIEGFKSFRKVELSTGRMNLFVGPNGSGKSNFFDALRVLQGIGNGFTVGEILDGKPRSATHEVWQGIRGGSGKACLDGGRSTGQFSLTVEGRRPVGRRRWQKWEYSVSIAPASGRVVAERLSLADDLIYYSGGDVGGPDQPFLEVRYYHGKPGRQPHLKLDRSRTALCQLPTAEKVTRAHAAAVAQIASQLADMQRIDPAPAQLRDYSQAVYVERMGERGENFAALVGAFCDHDSDLKEAYVGWLRELRPREVDDVDVVYGAIGEPMFMLREAGKEFPAPVLSDGTLRFAAIAAAFFQPDMPGLITIEEIENGIHPSRVRLLVELIRSNASDELTQVMATTHSPTVLDWLMPEEYDSTYYFARDPESGEGEIVALSDLPGFTELAEEQSVAQLFADGWMEDVR